MQLLWVCVGGATGSGARYLLSVWALQRWGRELPIGTFLVNLIGSFAMGIVMTARIPPSIRIPLATGVLGGFTTYSAFNFEMTKSLQDGRWGLALGYAAVTFATCLLAGFAGLAVGSTLDTAG